MAIAEFNKDNPFVYMSKSINDRLVTESFKATRILTVLLIVSVIDVILASIRVFVVAAGTMDALVYATIGSLFSLSYSMTKKAIQSVRTKEINYMLYSDEYSHKYVNTEQLISQVVNMHISYGKIVFSQNVMRIFIALDGFFGIYILLDILAHTL